MLAARRNLWLVIIAHGFYNTLIFVLIYLGLYP
jgi:membrane protease YdiL (CAAX protease family)